MTAPQVSRAELHSLLDMLLEQAEEDAGQLAPDGLRDFLAGLVQGRGITERWHEAGLEALRAVPDSPKKTFNERQARAYHLGLLAQLLLDLGGLPGSASPLPGNFQHGVIVHDLQAMRGGQGGLGTGWPLVLSPARKGQDGLVKAARRHLVGVVRWRMGYTGKGREDIWRGLMGDRAEKTKLDRWQREFGGADGDFCQACQAAGKAGDLSSPYAASDQNLAEIIDLANKARGKRAKV